MSTWLTPQEWTAVGISLKVAFTAMAASLLPGIAIAFVLERRRFWGRGALDVLVHLPLVLPPVVVGYLLLLGFGRRGPIGAFLAEYFGIVLSFRWTGRGAGLRHHGVPPAGARHQVVAGGGRPKTRGCGGHARRPPVWVFFAVTLPLILPGILAGMVLCFAKAMGEFGATITFVSNIPGETQTLPSAIYTFTQVPGGEGGALRLTLVSIIISVGALSASEWMARRVKRKLSPQ